MGIERAPDDDGGGWIAASTPPESTDGRHLTITVLGVIDVPAMRLNGDEPFVDVVSYWPARKLWTVTHQCRADESAMDYVITVRCWQPLPQLPPPWSALWA